jgi:hypothetical protein
MKSLDYMIQQLKGASILDDIIGLGQALFAGRLGGQHGGCPFPGHGIPTHETFQLQGLWAVHHQDAIHHALTSGLDKQGNHEYGIGSPGFCQLLGHGQADGGMEKAFDGMAQVGIGKQALS